MTRIKYTYCEGCYLTQQFVAGNFLVDVMIMPLSNKFAATFYKNKSNRGFKRKEENTLPKLKRVIKLELKALGVKFEDEVRPRLKR